MGRLVYSMFTSLDGYASDTSGSSDWAGAGDPELHDHAADQSRGVGTYLYGRRRYQTMTFWETALGGPALAAQALRAGIVDEVHSYVSPVSVGGGLRFWPEGLRLDLDLLDERRFRDGAVWLRYAVRR